MRIGWLQSLCRVLIITGLVTLLVAALLDLIPGSPASALLGSDATPQQVAQVNHEYGFDQPLLVRYGSWMSGIVQGNFGRSYATNEQVTSIVSSRLPVTAELAFGAELIAFAVAIMLSMLAVLRPGRFLDRAITGTSSVLVAAPAFVVAILLVYVFALKLGWLPPTGWVRLTTDPVGNLRSAILPWVSLAIAEIGILTKVLRDDLESTLRQDFIASARAMGLPTRTIMFRYALRPSLVATTSLAGVSLGRLLGGAIIVEYFFSLPGIGATLVQAINSKDLPVVQDLVLLGALAYLALGLLVDAAHRLLDPRAAHVQ